MTEPSWGIIRYAPGSGPFPEDDAAAFDGWYFDRALALAVAEDWHRRFPHWIVALVQSEVMWFDNSDYSPSRHRPLTFREAELAGEDS
jgi:hypothetical protein